MNNHHRTGNLHILYVAGDENEIDKLFSKSFHPTDAERHYGRQQYLYIDSRLFGGIG